MSQGWPSEGIFMYVIQDCPIIAKYSERIHKLCGEVLSQSIILEPKMVLLGTVEECGGSVAHAQWQPTWGIS